jgi:hypothetical protein
MDVGVDARALQDESHNPRLRTDCFFPRVVFQRDMRNFSSLIAHTAANITG